MEGEWVGWVIGVRIYRKAGVECCEGDFGGYLRTQKHPEVRGVFVCIKEIY